MSYGERMHEYGKKENPESSVHRIQNAYARLMQAQRDKDQEKVKDEIDTILDAYSEDFYSIEDLEIAAKEYGNGLDIDAVIAIIQEEMARKFIIH